MIFHVCVSGGGAVSWPAENSLHLRCLLTCSSDASTHRPWLLMLHVFFLIYYTEYLCEHLSSMMLMNERQLW